ncbi:MAG TPA: protein tyrosine phosphatase [Candidatus Paceibacterota bacterium]
MAKPRILFICTANINRSRTAEDLFKSSDKYEVQSAGFVIMSMSGQILTQELVNWANRIFLMNEVEDGHLAKLNEGFDVSGKDVTVLNIRDIYNRGDNILVQLLLNKLASYGIDL